MGGNADIRAYALSLPNGMHYVTTTAETVNVPKNYNYCSGYILKRSGTSIVIALFNGGRTAQCNYGSGTWYGWSESILDSDYGYVRADVDNGQSYLNLDIQSGNKLTVYKNGTKIGSVTLTP